MNAEELETLAKRIVRTINVPPNADPDDVQQECVLRILARVKDGYEGDKLRTRVWGDMRTWLHESWVDLYRPEIPYGAPLIDPGPSADDALHSDFADALGRLTEDQREVVQAIVYENKSQADIAAQRGTSVCAVKRIFARAKVVLGDYLAAYAED